MHQLIPVLASTACPALLILSVAYPLRPQGGRMVTHPRPASRVLAHCAVDREQGLIPADQWGGVRRASLWTVSA